MKSRWQDVSRVVCVRLDNLGDVLMTTPAIRALKASLGAARGRPPHVTLLGSTAGCEVGRFVPEIDAVLAYDAPWVAAGRDMPVKSDIGSRLAAHRFDAAVIFTCYSQSALPAAMLCGQAGIPLRLAHCRENPYGLLTDWVRDPEPVETIRHEAERQLALVAAVGATTTDDRLSLNVDEAARRRAADILDAHEVDPGGAIVVHPGATAASRRWPAERFGAVANALRRTTGRPVLVTGGPSERELTAQVVAAADAEGVHDLGGALPLDALIATIDAAALLVSNNSGPAHIAAACQTPVVDLYALTNPQHTPWRVAQRVLSHDVPCRNCQRSICPEGHHRCLLGVDVDTAVAAALALLDETGATASRSAASLAAPFAPTPHAALAAVPSTASPSSC